MSGNFPEILSELLSEYNSIGFAQEQRKILYHATCEKFENISAKCTFEKLLWTANRADIAQTYIPENGSYTYISFNSFDNIIRPPLYKHENSAVFEIAKSIYGKEFDFEVKYGRRDMLDSWRIPEGFPKREDVIHYLHSIGYKLNKNGLYKLKLFIDNQSKYHILPANHKISGRLFIILPNEELNFCDLRTSDENDLLSPDHLKFEEFRNAINAGYDGVIINDFCQTENHGNVGHQSFGLTETGLSKCRWIEIEAKHFEPEDQFGWSSVTPELSDYIRNHSISVAIQEPFA